MKLRLLAIGIFMLFNAATFLLSAGIWTVGAAQAPAEAASFPQIVNSALIALSRLPPVLPAIGLFLGFAVFFAWFFSPGLRAWMNAPNFEDVRQWSVSFEWQGGGLGEHVVHGEPVLALHNCRFIHHSATQARVLDAKAVLQIHGEDEPLELDRHSLTQDAPPDAASQWATKPLSLPLEVPANTVIEGSFYFKLGVSLIRKIGTRYLIVFEHRSLQHRTIWPTECYDAKIQARYTGRIGYPLRFPWRIRWSRFRAEGQKRRRQRDIERKIQP